MENVKIVLFSLFTALPISCEKESNQYDHTPAIVQSQSSGLAACLNFEIEVSFSNQNDQDVLEFVRMRINEIISLLHDNEKNQNYNIKNLQLVCLNSDKKLTLINEKILIGDILSYVAEFYNCVCIIDKDGIYLLPKNFQFDRYYYIESEFKSVYNSKLLGYVITE